NGGKKVTPSLLDRVQDRYGTTVYPEKKPDCPSCNDPWRGQAAPQIPDTRPPVIDEVTAYQMVSMLQGVVERGTAASLKSLGRPLAGKTGTTNDYKDAWFIGFSPEIVAGVWIGYDTPKSLGEGESGGTLAVPVFGEFMGKALAGKPATPFRTPAGVSFVTIDARTGGLPSATTTDTIVEAFRPGTEPTRSVASNVISYGGTTNTATPENGQKPTQGQDDLNDLY
ncbi:MAG: penicillin-binding transpeptidase domain-containing protein, partial [Caulobacterales bacterium]